jgi:hypothetical protein
MLILPIKKQWFDLIKQGIKKEEYREIKPYYTTRFTNLGLLENGNPTNKEIVVLFRNGYSQKSPSFQAICTLSIDKKDSKYACWGAVTDKTYYVLTIERLMV